MKRGITMKMRMMIMVALMAGAMAGMAQADAIKVSTAKQALALANGSVDDQVRDQLLVMEGTRSDTSLQPRQWDITLFDTGRANGGTMVRVRDGAVMSVGASIRMFDDARWKKFGRNFTGYEESEVINMGRWGVDSDRLIAIIRDLPKMSNVQITEVRMTLRKLSDGDVPPIWTAQLRARPKHNPSRERWIGRLQVDAETGVVLVDNVNVDILLK